MRFWDTNNIEINSKINYNWLNTTNIGIACLLGGISYYSWNYYQNWKQNEKKTIEKETNKITKLNEVKSENISNGTTSMITNNSDDYQAITTITKVETDNEQKDLHKEITLNTDNANQLIQNKIKQTAATTLKKQNINAREMIVNQASQIETEYDILTDYVEAQETDYDMLDDVKEAINEADEWAIVDLPAKANNYI